MERGFSRIWRIFADFFGRIFKSAYLEIYVMSVFLLYHAPSVPLCLCVKKSFIKEWKLYALPTFIICQKDFFTQRHRGTEGARHSRQCNVDLNIAFVVGICRFFVGDGFIRPEVRAFVN